MRIKTEVTACDSLNQFLVFKTLLSIPSNNIIGNIDGIAGHKRKNVKLLVDQPSQVSQEISL